jgi:adenylate kinase family enzyme
LFFVSGDSGAGKSTWIERQLLGGWAVRPTLLSVGDRLRQLEGEKVRRGSAVPLASAAWGDDDVASSLVAQALAELKPGGVLVVDGFPRRPAQVAVCEWLAREVHHVGVVWLVVEPEVALARYAAAGFKRSPVSGKYGPEGELCPLGGRFTEPLEEHYLEKRRLQSSDLQRTKFRVPARLHTSVVDGSTWEVLS